MTIYPESSLSTIADADSGASAHLVTRAAVDLVGVDGSVVLSLKPHGLQVEATAGMSMTQIAALGSFVETVSPELKGAIVRETLIVGDIGTEPPPAPWAEVMRVLGGRSLVVVPVESEGSTMGFLVCVDSSPRCFSVAEMTALTALAAHETLAHRRAAARLADRARVSELEHARQALSEELTSLRRAEATHERLRMVVLEGGGIETIAQALGEVLTHHVLVLDGSGDLLAQSHPDSPSAGRELSAVRRSPDAAAVIRTAFNRRALADGPAGECLGQIVATPVFVNGAPAASILVLRVERVEAFMRRVLQTASTIVALDLLRTRVRHHARAAHHSELVHAVLDRQFSDMDELLVTAYRAGTELTRRLAFLVVRSYRSGRATSLPMTREERLRLCADLVRELATMAHSVPVAVVGEEIGLLVPATVSLDRLERLLARAHEHQNPELTWHLALGTWFESMDDVSRSFDVARRAVRLAQRLDRRALLDVNRFGAYGLLLTATHPDQLVQFCEIILAPLREYDHERGGELLETLRKVVIHGRGVRELARRQHVHPNTVKYRLGLIRRLTGRDLARPEDLLELTLAVMVEDISPDPA